MTNPWLSKPWWTGQLLSELHGRRMVLSHDCMWRDIILPAGSKVTLDRVQSRGQELHFRCDPCCACGAQFRACIPRGDLAFDPDTDRGFRHGT